MNTILTYLNKIPKDKWQHFVLGIVIATVAFLCFLFLAGFWVGLLISVAVVATVAYAKEVWDGKNGGTFDWMDFVATVAGGAWIWLPLLAVHLFL